MARTYPSLKPLTEQLMKEMRDYGICEVSTGQYQHIDSTRFLVAYLSGSDSIGMPSAQIPFLVSLHSSL